MAVIEAPPSVTRHLSVEDGRLLVDSKQEWQSLRHFRVKIVEIESPKFDSKPDMQSDAELLIQLKPDPFHVGVNAIAALPIGREGSFPFYIDVRLHLRVHVRGASGKLGDFGFSTGGSHGVLKSPDDDAKDQALVKILSSADRSLQGRLGVQMLRVRKGEEADKTTFYVHLENVYPFTVKGSLRFPEEEQYRVVDREQPFHLAAGDSIEFKVPLTPTAPDGGAVIPTWWTSKFGSERNRAFEFPELELNVPLGN